MEIHRVNNVNNVNNLLVRLERLPVNARTHREREQEVDRNGDDDRFERARSDTLPGVDQVATVVGAGHDSSDGGEADDEHGEEGLALDR